MAYLDIKVGDVLECINRYLQLFGWPVYKGGKYIVTKVDNVHVYILDDCGLQTILTYGHIGVSFKKME